MELLTKLGINWGLLLAQIVNFFLLVGILGVFVYQPILKLLDRRRALIRKSIEDAEKVEEQLRGMDRIRAEKLAVLDRECGEILERTKREAERMKQEVLALAQREADRILERGRSALEQERTHVLSEVSATLSMVILRATEQIVKREFGPADQKRMMHVVEQELSHLLR